MWPTENAGEVDRDVDFNLYPKQRYTSFLFLIFMKIGRKPKPESPEEMRLVHHALENSTRRKMLILMNEGILTIQEIARTIGPAMLDYHLHRLELAGLIEVEKETVILTDSGKAYGTLV